MSNRSFDAIVVGAGVMGSASAWRLALRGRSVLLLEQFELGHTLGSSHGGARIFRYAYPDPEYVAMARRARPLWAELESESETTVIDVTGGVDHGDPRAVAGVTDALDAAQVPYDRWSAGEANERFPNLRFDGEVCYQADAGRCRADTAVDAFVRCALARGVDLHERERVVALETTGGGARGVRTDAGEYSAPLVVIAAGAWVGALVGLSPILVTREQYVHLRPRDAEQPWPSFIHYRDPVAAYGLEAPGVGIKLGAHHSGEIVADPDEGAPIPSVEASARLLEYASQWIPGVEPVALSVETCLYTSTTSEDFVVDRVGPVVICSPCSGHGFKFAPLIGELVAGLADGSPAPERFRLARQGLRTSLV